MQSRRSARLAWAPTALTKLDQRVRPAKPETHPPSTSTRGAHVAAWPALFLQT